MTDPVRPSDVGTLFDAPPAKGSVMGDNRPPPFDPDVLKEKEAEVSSFVEAAGEWLDLGEIQNDEQQGYLTDFVDGARKKAKQLEEWRVATKEPHRKAAEAVDNAVKPAGTKLRTALDRALDMLGKYQGKKKREAEAAAQRAREEAARVAQEAEQKRLQAIERNDISGEVDAEATKKEAEATARQADRAAEDAGRARSASGAGRTIAMVKIKTARIDNIRLAFMAVQDSEIVVEAVQRALNQKIRAAGFTGGIPGVTIEETEKAR
jgi:hypothetical protein